MQVLEKIKILPKINFNIKVQAFILKSPSTKNSYNEKILGRTLSDWVAFSCGDFKYKIIEWDGKQNIIEFTKGKIDKSYDYTMILLSSTPLLERQNIKDIVEYVVTKQSNLCKLPVGYVVKNKYILDNINVVADCLYSQNMENFFIVENKKQFVQAEEILQDRINTFHMNNGVDIKKTKSVYIEPEVDIMSGAIIFAGNSIKGNSVISKDVILKENNVIENSKIMSESCISGSVIENSIIAKNVYVSAFCEIKDSVIGEGTVIGSGAKINKYKVDINTKIKPNTVLGENNDSDSRTGKSGQKL